MKMTYCWLYLPPPMTGRYQLWCILKYEEGPQSNHEGGTGQSHSDSEAGPLQCGHVSVAPIGIMNVLGGAELLLRGHPSAIFDPSVTKEFLLDDVKGHIHTTQRITIPPFWGSKHPWADEYLRALHVRSCADKSSVGSPIACLHCANFYVWKAAPRILLSANFLRKVGSYPTIIPQRSL